MKCYLIDIEGCPIAHDIGRVGVLAEHVLLVHAGIEAEAIVQAHLVLQLRLLHVLVWEGKSVEVIGYEGPAVNVHLAGIVNGWICGGKLRGRWRDRIEVCTQVALKFGKQESG